MSLMPSSFTTLALTTKIKKLSVQPRGQIKLNQRLFNTPHFYYLIAPLMRRGKLYSANCSPEENGGVSISLKKVLVSTKIASNRH